MELIEPIRLKVMRVKEGHYDLALLGKPSHLDIVFVQLNEPITIVP